MKKTDKVNHPSHYTSHPSGVECVDIAEWMTFNAGNTVKYLWRSGLKDGSPTLEDLRKARWYLDREIERVTKLTKGIKAKKRNSNARKRA
jgi:hypothetical protein